MKKLRQRAKLSNEAIRLTRAVHTSLPADGEVAELPALTPLTDARRQARTGLEGELIPLAVEQDRALWDCKAIDEGVASITTTLLLGFDWCASTAGGDLRSGARRGRARRGHRLAEIRLLAGNGLSNACSDNPDGDAARHRRGHPSPAPAGLHLLEALDGDERMAGHHRLKPRRAHLFEMAVIGKPPSFTIEPRPIGRRAFQNGTISSRRWCGSGSASRLGRLGRRQLHLDQAWPRG